MATFPLGHNANKILERRIKVHGQATRSEPAHWIVTAADSITLRGIPAIGRGVAGHIPGTNPQAQT